MRFLWAAIILFLMFVVILGLAQPDAPANAGAGGTLEDMSAAQVRALEKIAGQLDRINDTLREKCGR